MALYRDTVCLSLCQDARMFQLLDVQYCHASKKRARMILWSNMTHAYRVLAYCHSEGV